MDGNQIGMFDAVLGAAKRNASLAVVLEAFSADLAPHIARVIARLANSGADFTSDDIFARLSAEAREALAAHPNAIGALVQQAARRREIEKTGDYVPSARPDARHRTIAVWRGVR